MNKFTSIIAVIHTYMLYMLYVGMTVCLEQNKIVYASKKRPTEKKQKSYWTTMHSSGMNCLKASTDKANIQTGSLKEKNT